jgi:hypothetical protein
VPPIVESHRPATRKPQRHDATIHVGVERRPHRRLVEHRWLTFALTFTFTFTFSFSFAVTFAFTFAFAFSFTFTLALTFAFAFSFTFTLALTFTFAPGDAQAVAADTTGTAVAVDEALGGDADAVVAVADLGGAALDVAVAADQQRRRLTGRHDDEGNTADEYEGGRGRGVHVAMLPVAPGIANGALGVIPQARAHRTPRAKEPRERPSGAWQVVAVDDGCGAL